ncbi:MAG: hypothetical protein RLZZ370_1452 [Bacteroidota bacterium]|jgi:ABC-type dipeptide/oligopeptide/nickel transport system permease subunit
MRKFFRAGLSLWFIFLMAMAAISAYLWIPDQTSHANDICLPLAGQYPGASCTYIRQKNALEAQSTGSSNLGSWLFGNQPRGFMLPVVHARIQGDSIRVQLYEGEGIEGSFRTFARADLYTSVHGEFLHHRYFLLGTDRFGRDLFSRLILGARVSLGIGFCAVLLSMFIGIGAGLIAGYYGGITDKVISWLMGVLWSIPSMLLALAISFALGKGFVPMLLAIGLSTWVDVARMVRGQVLVLREQAFIQAGKVLGYSGFRMMVHHLLPNLRHLLLVVAASTFASSILLEAGLSFLGLGIAPPIPSWGNMVREHYGYLVLGKAYLALVPGLTIMATVLAFQKLSQKLGARWNIRKN